MPTMRLPPRFFRATFSFRSRQMGLTLIEVLVAMIIGLLGVVVIFTVFQNAEGYKRTTIAGGDAQTNGSVSLFAIERYVRTAGSSITTTNETQPGLSTSPPRANLLLGCPLIPNPNGLGLPDGSSLITGPVGQATPVAPVRIVDGSQLAGGTPATSDVLVIMAGNADIATNPTVAGPIAAGATVAPSVSDVYGWRLAASRPTTNLSDIALITASSTAGAATISPVNCSARRLFSLTSAVPGPAPSGTGTFTFTVATPGVAYPATNLHNLGPSPYFLSIGVNARQQLVQTNFMPLLTGPNVPAVQTVLAEGIINMQAQYGIDTNQDDVIDAWVEPTGAWANPITVNAPARPAPGVIEPPAINQIKAIRIAVLARAKQFEAPDRTQSPPVCNATPAPAAAQDFLLLGVPATAGSLAMPQGVNILPAIIASGPSAAADSNWQCFRYRRYETVIPVINMLRSPL